MKYRFLLSILFLLMNISLLFAQKKEIPEQINKDVWVRFYHAFNSLDHKISEEIHTKDVIRIPANQNLIIDYNSYMKGIKESFIHSKEKNETKNIELRFLRDFPMIALLQNEVSISSPSTRTQPKKGITMDNSMSCW